MTDVNPLASEHEKLNYVEFAASDLKATSDFFSKAFAWEFTWYGDDYVSFANQGLDGGFYKANLRTREADGGAILIFYSSDLESSMQKVEAAGGKITKAIFSFPGGRRFHFHEPSGNEFAVWSDLEAQ
ncbi:VOC family protein [Glaciecola sp. MH2013]|uniref:VOC family protein n=1 Tax=Glaciecola sp. MH2013 TaxID=2785524 RepID=UPI00189D4437|nr:VOC family protein [Glaciecola sp. MH2013]MBF7074524.1 VOC family protein [Glaciecola sp. MH2013]